VGYVTLRGRSEALMAYEPLTVARHADPAMCEYRAAFDLAATGDPAALSAFAALLSLITGDALTIFHLKRLLAGATGVAVALD
jgi:adenylate cyclase